VAFCHVRVPDGGLAFKTHRLLNHWDVGFGDGTVDAHAGALANNLRGVDQVFEGRLHTTRPGSAHDTGSDECQGNVRASWKCTRFPITCVGVSNTRVDVSIFPTGARAVPPSSRTTVGP